jgi:hypothetical protein
MTDVNDVGDDDGVEVMCVGLGRNLISEIHKNPATLISLHLPHSKLKLE